MSEPVPKITQLRAAAAKGDWVGAISIASKFGELGAHKAFEYQICMGEPVKHGRVVVSFVAL